MLALAQSDAAGAKAHFAQCLSTDVYCRWQEVVAADLPQRYNYVPSPKLLQKM